MMQIVILFFLKPTSVGRLLILRDMSMGRRLSCFFVLLDGLASSWQKKILVNLLDDSTGLFAIRDNL